jgi:hypothetical protein
MSEAGCEFAERNQLLIMEKTGSEMPRPIEHHVNENGGQFGTFASHLGNIGPMHRDQFRRLFGYHVSGRRNQP